MAGIVNYHLTHAELTAEVVWLRAELTRVRGERNRLFVIASNDDRFDIYGAIDREEQESIERTLRFMSTTGQPASVAVAAALVEHDRLATERKVT